MQQQQTFYNLEGIHVHGETFPPNSNPTKEGTTSKPDSAASNKTLSSELQYCSKIPVQPARGNFIEVKTFLPTKVDKMISSRYENPLTQLKSSTKKWKAFTLFFSSFSFMYFALNLWGTLVLSNMQISSQSPKPIVQVSLILEEMQDMMFYNYTMNVVMDIWALVIYAGLTIILLRESTTEIEKSFEEKGKLERIVTRALNAIVILFGLSYIAGTVYLLGTVHNQVPAKDLINLLVFHSAKMIYLLLNVVIFRQYKQTKHVYEDLLLEALEPSDCEDEKSECEDPNDDEESQVYP